MALFCCRCSHGDEAEGEEVGWNASIGRATRLGRDYWFSSPRFEGKRRDANAYRALFFMNVLETAFICLSGILVYEMSIKALQQQFTRTAIFPLCLPRAMGMAIAANHQGSVALGNFIGFSFSRIYMSVRSSNPVGHSRFVAVFLFAILGTCESQIGAWFMRKWLCQHPRKKVPTFDNVAQAICYILIVFCSSLVFETLIAISESVTKMLEWKYFFQYWGTWWLGVLSAMLTLSPAVIHLMALEPPLHSMLFSKKKLMSIKLSIKSSFKAIILWSLTLGLLILVFLYSVRTFIRPLPYLLFPLIICAAFQFNRVGWSLVVAVSSLFCAVGTLHRDSSLYYMAGAPKDKASPSLVLQIELFISVIGLVGIVLAAAVKEKNQLTHDLNRANEDLEKTVEERTKDLVKANEELQVSQKMAEHANHAKSEFLANMSHEIRTPIHGILGLTTLLLESKLTKDQRESLISLKECADLLLHIINSVLDLTKIEAGCLEVERVPFSIRRLVSSTLRMLQTGARDRGLKLLWEVQAEVPDLLVGDTGKIQQCLLNLVGNALKFTNNGTVTVRVVLPTAKEEPAATKSTTAVSIGGANLGLEEMDNSAQLLCFSSPNAKPSPTSFAKLRSWSSWPGAYFKVESVKEEEEEEIPAVADICDASVEARFGSSKVAPVTEIEKSAEENPFSDESIAAKKPVHFQFEVQDTGIGIIKDKLQDIFNPFTQADPSTSRIYGGTGLGLSIVQRFVELLGGTVWADSVVGKGSTFIFKLPFVALSGDKDGMHPSSASAAGSSKLVKNPKLEQSARNASGRELVGTLLPNSSHPHRLSRAAEIPQKHTDVFVLEKLRSITTPSPTSQEKQVNSSLSPSLQNQDEVSRERCEISMQHNRDVVIDVQEVNNGRFLQGSDRHRPEGVASSGSLNLTAGQSSTDLKLSPNGPYSGHNLAPPEDIVQTSQSALQTQQHEKFVSESQKRHRKAAVAVVAPPRKDAPERRLELLLAEDNPINQKVATRQLEKYGHKVTIVGDGRQALETVQVHHDMFDVVLMDVQMPNMDGLQATQLIREVEQQEGWSRLPILGLTAHAIHGYQETCLSHGMDGYLGKPFDIKQLLIRMIEILPSDKKFPRDEE